jgi:hypothetical protein
VTWLVKKVANSIDLKALALREAIRIASTSDSSYRSQLLGKNYSSWAPLRADVPMVCC